MGAFDDLIPGGAFDDLIPRQETPVGNLVDNKSRMLLDFENAASAGAQGTTPNIDAHRGRFISADTHTSDSGDLLFRDPVTKELVPTDQNKHIAIRDPRDNTIKVFARSAQTDEGPVEGISRILAPGLATGPVSTVAKAARAATPRREVLESAEWLTENVSPVQVPRAIASDNLLTQQAGAQLRNVPVLGTPLVKNTERTISQLEDAVGNVARAQGGADMETAGTIASGHLTDWIGPRSKEIVSRAYDAVDEAIDPSVRGRLEDALGATSEILARRQNARLGDSKAVNLIIDALQDPRGLNYHGVKDLRTSIGEFIDGGRLLPADMSGAELKQIYGALTKDLGAIAELSGGSRARMLWERANSVAAGISERRKELSSLVGSHGDAAPAKVFDRIFAAASGKSRADTDLLIKAKNVIGDDWDEVVSGVTAKLGRNPQGQFAPGQFLRDWEKLSAAGKSALYGTGAHREALDHIARVSQRWPQLQKFQNPSGTAQTVMGGSLGAALVMHPIATLASILEPTTMAGIAGATIFSRALASPASAASMSAWARAYEGFARAKSAGAMSRLNIASRNLANTLNSQHGTSLSPMDFLRAIQGTNPAKSDQE